MLQVFGREKNLLIMHFISSLNVLHLIKTDAIANPFYSILLRKQQSLTSMILFNLIRLFYICVDEIGDENTRTTI